MRSPVLFMVFNRPDVTKQVFGAIREARPSRLYIAADGPRAAKKGEVERCAEVLEIVNTVDWPCKVQTLIREKNLGCKIAVSSAITWFYENEPEGIILEDDCLPHADFFEYADELLERYRFDERIGLISGTALIELAANKMLWNNEDYVFSRYPSIWGWASWRRVWTDYDVHIKAWEHLRSDISPLTQNKKLRKINDRLFDLVQSGQIDTWDYQVSLLLWSTNRLSIAPKFNLIRNIGFGADATHTKNPNDTLAKKLKVTAQQFSFPLKSPLLIMPNHSYQRWIETFATRSYIAKLIERVKSYVLG